MGKINREELINIINISVLDYISKLEDIKNTYKKDIDNFIKLSKLYENINKNRYGFIIEYYKSSKKKKDNFIDLLNIVYKDDKHINRLINEIDDTHNLLNRGFKVNLKYYNKFLNDLENSISKLCIKLNPSELYRIEDLIEDYLELSYIFDKEKIKYNFDSDKFIELIKQLDIDKDLKVQIIEFGIKELLYVNNYEEIIDLEEYEELIPRLDDIVLEVV